MTHTLAFETPQPTVFTTPALYIGIAAMARTKAAARSAETLSAAILNAAPPPAQLETINAWAEDIGIWYKFNKLGESSEHTFLDVGKTHHKETRMHEKKLFLGKPCQCKNLLRDIY